MPNFKALTPLLTPLPHRSSTVHHYATPVRVAAVPGELPYIAFILFLYLQVGLNEQRRISDDVPGTQVVSTSGPDSRTGNIIPQMFISFRGQLFILYQFCFWVITLNVDITEGTAIYVRTSPLTNASANFTLSSSSTSTQVYTTSLHDSPDFVFGAMGLTPDLFELSVTYLPDVDGVDGSSGRLDIGSITVTVTNSR